MVKTIAEEIAREAHKGQHRWGGEPYISHPEAIVEQLKLENWDCVNNDDLIATAWLHDVMEDVGITGLELLHKKIPLDVIIAVIAMTKLPYEDYLDYILRVRLNEIARIVKLGDITHNLSTLRGDQKDRAAKYKLAKYILVQL